MLGKMFSAHEREKHSTQYARPHIEYIYTHKREPDSEEERHDGAGVQVCAGQPQHEAAAEPYKADVQKGGTDAADAEIVQSALGGRKNYRMQTSEQTAVASYKGEYQTED